MAIAACDLEVRTEGVDGRTWTTVSCSGGSAEIEIGDEPEFTYGMVGTIVRMAATGGAVAGLYEVVSVDERKVITLDRTPTVDGETPISGGEMTVYPNGGGFKIGGSGTDYSQQDTPEVVFTDLECALASNTTLTSATGGFGASDAIVGNLIYIGEGTNAVAGWYEITAWASTNSVTIDRTCASGGNMTAGVGIVGGGFRSPGQAAAMLHANAIAGHRVHQEEGTYNNTETTVNVAGGPLDFANGVHSMYNKVLYWEGYKTTRGDLDGTITIDANGNAPASGYMWRMGGASSGSHHVVNIALDADSQASIDGFYSPLIEYNNTDTCSVTAADIGHWGVSANRCLATSCATGFGSGFASLCVAASCTSYGFNNTTISIDCIAYGCGRGWYVQTTKCNRCLAYNCTTAGFESYVPARTSRLTDCIAYGCGTSFLGMEYSVLVNCADGLSTSGRYDVGGDPIADINPITLSNTVGDVFVNAAGGDFRLVNTAGGGALLWAKALGVTGQTDNNRDIGAVQHADPAGGGGIFMPAARQIGV